MLATTQTTTDPEQKKKLLPLAVQQPDGQSVAIAPPSQSVVPAATLMKPPTSIVRPPTEDVLPPAPTVKPPVVSAQPPALQPPVAQPAVSPPLPQPAVAPSVPLPPAPTPGVVPAAPQVTPAALPEDLAAQKTDLIAAAAAPVATALNPAKAAATAQAPTIIPPVTPDSATLPPPPVPGPGTPGEPYVGPGSVIPPAPNPDGSTPPPVGNPLTVTGPGSGSAVALPTQTPITGTETPYQVNPGVSDALQGTLAKLQEAATADPSVMADPTFQAQLDQAKASYDAETQGLTEQTNADLARRGIDYSSIAGANIANLELNRRQGFQQVLNPILQQQASNAAANKQAQISALQGATGTTSAIESGLRGEQRTERSYTDTLATQAHDQAVAEAAATEQSQTASDTGFQSLLTQALGLGTQGSAAGITGMSGAGNLLTQDAALKAQQDAADSAAYGQLAQAGLTVLLASL